MADPEKASDVIRRLLAALGTTAKEAQYEGFCAVTGVAGQAGSVLFFADRRGAAPGGGGEADARDCSRTPVLHARHLLRGRNRSRPQGDPVARAKRELIASGGLVVYRLSSLWDQARPGAQAAALATALDWQPEAARKSSPGRRLPDPGHFARSAGGED